MRDEPPGTEGGQHKAFVGGLSYHINNDDLRKAFERYDATSAEVMTDKFSGKPRGFGFVYFKDDQGLKEAIDQMHEKELEGRRISVTRAVPQEQTKPGTPAAALGGGTGARREYGRRETGGSRGYDRGYDRGYSGGYDRGGYDRGGYGGGYDPRYAYDRAGYDRGGYGGGYGGGGGGYERDPYKSDPYGRSGGAYSSGYGSGGYGSTYEDRAGYGGGSSAYDYGRSAYDDRGAGGPERRGGGYSAPRSGPYDRPADRRPADPPRR